MEKLILYGKIILGNLMIAVAVNAFILPFSFISGGSTGLGMLFERYFHLPFQTGVMLVTIVCFFAGLIVLGKKFALQTLLSSIIYPVFISVTSFLTEMPLISDGLVAAIFGGLIMGIGLGMIIQSGASSGGMDIPPLIAEKLFHIPVSIGLWVLDLSILLLQVPASTPMEIICGLVLICVYMGSMDRILTLGKASVQILIMSEKYKEIGQALMKKEDKGVTFFEMESGYEGRKGKAICSVFPQKDLAGIRQTISSIDPSAFMIVSSVQEVRGYRFRKFNNHSLPFSGS